MNPSIPESAPRRDWELECETAERETDPTKLRTLLEQIEAAMFTRFQELGTTELQEREAILRAAKIMRRLHVERD